MRLVDDDSACTTSNELDIRRRLRQLYQRSMRPDFLRSLTGLLLKLALAPRFAAPRPSALGDTRSAIRGSRTGANTPKSRVDHFELRKALRVRGPSAA